MIMPIQNSLQHPHSVCTVVSWPVSEDEKLAGIEEDNDEVTPVVQPEFKLPNVAGKVLALQWNAHDSANIFWGIRRQDKETSPSNGEVLREDVMVKVASTPSIDVERLNAGIEPSAQTHTATVSVTMNTRPIKADKDLVLKWHTQVKENKQSHKRGRTWVENLAIGEKKRYRATNESEHPQL